MFVLAYPMFVLAFVYMCMWTCSWTYYSIHAVYMMAAWCAYLHIRTHAHRECPLTLAAEKGHTELAQLLLSRYVQIHVHVLGAMAMAMDCVHVPVNFTTTMFLSSVFLNEPATHVTKHIHGHVSDIISTALIICTLGFCMFV